MEPQQRPRLEPRLVFAFLMLAIPVLYLVGQVVLVRPGDGCSGQETQAGGLAQMFVPGVGCEQPVKPRTPRD